LRLLPVIAGVMIALAALAPELSPARIDERGR
jgi:hypothetical protein